MRKGTSWTPGMGVTPVIAFLSSGSNHLPRSTSGTPSRSVPVRRIPSADRRAQGLQGRTSSPFLLLRPLVEQAHRSSSETNHKTNTAPGIAQPTAAFGQLASAREVALFWPLSATFFRRIVQLVGTSQRRNQHLVDARAVAIDDFEIQPVPSDFFAGDGDVSEQFDQHPGQRVVIAFLFVRQFVELQQLARSSVAIEPETSQLPSSRRSAAG